MAVNRFKNLRPSILFFRSFCKGSTDSDIWQSHTQILLKPKVRKRILDILEIGVFKVDRNLKTRLVFLNSNDDKCIAELMNSNGLESVTKKVYNMVMKILYPPQTCNIINLYQDFVNNVDKIINSRKEMSKLRIHPLLHGTDFRIGEMLMSYQRYSTFMIVKDDLTNKQDDGFYLWMGKYNNFIDKNYYCEINPDNINPLGEQVPRPRPSLLELIDKNKARFPDPNMAVWFSLIVRANDLDKKGHAGEILFVRHVSTHPNDGAPMILKSARADFGITGGKYRSPEEQAILDEYKQTWTHPFAKKCDVEKALTIILPNLPGFVHAWNMEVEKTNGDGDIVADVFGLLQEKCI